MAFSATLANGIVGVVQNIVFLSRTERQDKGKRDNKECLPEYIYSPYKHKPIEYPCDHDCPV